MTRLTIVLTPDERLALFTLAERELREPGMQAALLIRTELERSNLLPPPAALKAAPAATSKDHAVSEA